MADSRETQFQQDIIAEMQASGWLVGTAAGYDRANAVYTEDLVGYFAEAWPERWEKFCKANPQQPEKALVQKVVRQLERDGTLAVLRHGFKVPGNKIDLCSFKPDHGMNPDTERRYRANRLRVVPEVSYSPHWRKGEYDPRLDLVLFVNGLPTATLELKSEFKQSVEKAKKQYKDDRPPKDPVTRKPEPLLTFKRGALVHFAVSQDKVAMTTKLAGKDTFFLPFDQGTPDGGAGNPQAPDQDQYATAYLWQRLFQPDAWLKVLGRFLHLEVEEKENFHGQRQKKESLIFPRFHQWDVVNQLVATTRAQGAGKRYLIQHSAGSGKSNSIAWTAHQLSQLYDEAGSKLFSSVIVVTDRTVLDSQLQETIYQFEHAEGVVQRITRDIGNQSKSEQLAEALLAQTRIIVVTIQTFPALFDALKNYPKLAEGRYAVIADEAHSSQTGSSANKLKTILGGATPEGESVSAEELLDAAAAARGPTEAISYYAFTATPKGKTLELFGREPNPDEPRGEGNKPEPFHVYSMRQAIEEGFILDVLQNYTTYSVAWKLAHPEGHDDEVDSKKARTTLAKWVRLHPHNINQKVEVIVEHFRSNVRHLLGGQAKAMVVTGSRQEAVRYQLAMRAYVKDKGYGDVHPLVAFSGSIPPDEHIPDEVTETSERLNPGLKGRDHAEAFKTQEYNVMIAANKYQTGFDQPKLCAMYVDKTLKGVDCVQTLSRLNRTFPGKDTTMVLDFVNDPDDILEAFLPYYNKAELTDVSDAQVVYDLQDALDRERIYQWSEVRAFAEAFFNPKVNASRLSYHCKPAVDRFKARYKCLQEERQGAKAALRRARQDGDERAIQSADDVLKDIGEQIDELDLFKKNLGSFVRAYEFLSQIVFFDDGELEQLCVYAKNLLPLLRIDRIDDDDIDISELALTHYRLTKRKEHQLKLAESGEEYGLDPLSGVGSGKPHDPEKKRLSEIIEALNDIFGAEVHDEDQINNFNDLQTRLKRNKPVMDQLASHTAEQAMHGLYPAALEELLLDALEDKNAMATAPLEDKDKFHALALLLRRAVLGELPDLRR